MIELENLGKNNKLFKLKLGTKSLFFSYETCIGIICEHGKYMTNEKFSVTTAKHKNVLRRDFGLNEIEKETFENILKEELK